MNRRYLGLFWCHGSTMSAIRRCRRTQLRHTVGPVTGVGGIELDVLAIAAIATVGSAECRGEWR